MRQLTTPQEAREQIRRHLAEDIKTSTAHLPMDAGAAQAVADAITAYCEEQFIAPPLPTGYLDMMVYRALKALNQTEAAGFIAQTRLPQWDIHNVFDPAIWPGPVPLIVWRLFASQIVRPSRTVTAGGKVLWILDFARLHREDAGWMEITFFPGLRALVTQLAAAWDDTAGEGYLGLRGLYAAGFAPTPRRKPKKNAAHSDFHAGEIRAYILQVLEHVRRDRGWKQCPRVLYLEFPPRKKKR